MVVHATRDELPEWGQDFPASELDVCERCGSSGILLERSNGRSVLLVVEPGGRLRDIDEFDPHENGQGYFLNDAATTAKCYECGLSVV